MTTDDSEKKLPADAAADWLEKHGISEERIFIGEGEVRSSNPLICIHNAAGRILYMSALWSSNDPEDRQKLGQQLCWLASTIQTLRAELDPDAPSEQEARLDLERFIRHRVTGPSWTIGDPLPSEGQE